MAAQLAEVQRSKEQAQQDKARLEAESRRRGDEVTTLKHQLSLLDAAVSQRQASLEQERCAAAPAPLGPPLIPTKRRRSTLCIVDSDSSVFSAPFP